MASETAPSKVDGWVEKLDASRIRYLQRISKMRAEVRADKSLSELDRAVLGATGSSAELRRYATMAGRIKDLLGSPIVVVEAEERGVALNAVGGIIAGAVEAELTHRDKTKDTDDLTMAALSVPVTDKFRWYRNDGIEELGRGESSIVIAHFSAGTGAYFEEGGRTYESRISPESVLLGRGPAGGVEFAVTRTANEVADRFAQLAAAQAD